MKAIDAMLRHWRRTGVQLNRGASEVELEQLMMRLGVNLPEDVLYCFSSANGMADGESTERLACLWSIVRIIAETAVISGRDAYGEFQDFPFIDVMLDAWQVYFRVRNGTFLSIVGGSQEFVSLEDYFRRYQQDPDAFGW